MSSTSGLKKLASGAIDVRDKMKEILERENVQISTERIIVVSVKSPYVPSIDLVDMPGLVTAPHQVKELTRQVVNEHITKHGAYSIFLATVPASASIDLCCCSLGCARLVVVEADSRMVLAARSRRAKHLGGHGDHPTAQTAGEDSWNLHNV